MKALSEVSYSNVYSIPYTRMQKSININDMHNKDIEDFKIRYNNGVHNISNQEYHESEGLSRSALWEFKRSPKHYWNKYLNQHRETTTQSASMQLGELVHTLVLEPKEFDNRYYVMEKVNRATKAGKALYQDALAQAGDRIIINAQDYLIAEEMAKSVDSTELGLQLFKLPSTDIEKSIYFTHQDTGIQCKVRPDAMHLGVVTDLKTTADASYRSFQSSAYNYGYFLQAAMIKCAYESLGMNLDRFIFCCVEKTAPYAVSYYVVDEDALEYGEQQFNYLMSKFATCLDTDTWEGYEAQVLYKPAYALIEE